MYTIQVIIRNPMSDTSPAVMNYQFDPATMTQEKWSGAWEAIKTELDALVATFKEKEPTVW